MKGRVIRPLMTAAMLACLTGAACRPGADRKNGTDMPQRDIQTVQEANIPTLMALDGVVGVAIGERDDHTPCIVIYVKEMTEALRAALPTALEGHPVRVEVTGEIRPLGR
jgi:hypothetical protein